MTTFTAAGHLSGDGCRSVNGKDLGKCSTCNGSQDSVVGTLNRLLNRLHVGLLRNHGSMSSRVTRFFSTSRCSDWLWHLQSQIKAYLVHFSLRQSSWSEQLTALLRTEPRLIITEAMPPLPHTTSRCSQRLYLYFAFTNSISKLLSNTDFCEW